MAEVEASDRLGKFGARVPGSRRAASRPPSTARDRTRGRWWSRGHR